MITLRPDQEDVRAKLRVALRSSTSVLAFAPTGFGKTVLAAALIKLIFAAGKRVIFCVHRVDLIVQTAKTFERFQIPFSYIAAGHHYNPYHRVYIASIATLRNRLGKIPADYVMVDEAHLSAATGWATVALHYKETGARLIGYTGSPERLDGKPLGDVWDTMVMGPSVRWLIDNGHLSKYRAFSPAGLDLSGVHSRNGEFVSSEIDEIMAGKAVLAGAVRHWRKYAQGKRTIAFAPSIARCEQLAEEFRANGIVAVALDGNTPQADRRSAFVGFADRQIDLIVNCGLFCEGFDLAAQVDRDVTIEAVLDYAPSQSLARVLQKWGRGLRKKDEPAVLLDLVGGFSRHGFPDDEREWSLDGRKKADREVEAMTCPSCFATHPPAPKCPECKLVYPVKGREASGQGRLLDEVEGDLEEVDLDAVRRNRLREQGLAKSLDDLVNLATARGYRSPEKWAAHIFTARQSKLRAEQRGQR
ncbi:MAG: DEAD/DEAH box helicase family protein [Sphingomonas sp.]|uniref:DEAD/DEAH box helicase n=1 Tax=Sphingomonas sp. TaxID=28214 RepID=UPI002634F9C8|nr:DEAD/DEAH box helicase family protein [Sphingomonas sp.]MDK2769939.1 DEAD/DEAH box helicase family protein [Sphingomonas sp.]